MRSQMIGLVALLTCGCSGGDGTSTVPELAEPNDSQQAALPRGGAEFTGRCVQGDVDAWVMTSDGTTSGTVEIAFEFTGSAEIFVVAFDAPSIITSGNKDDVLEFDVAVDPGQPIYLSVNCATLSGSATYSGTVSVD